MDGLTALALSLMSLPRSGLASVGNTSTQTNWNVVGGGAVVHILEHHLVRRRVGARSLRFNLGGPSVEPARTSTVSTREGYGNNPSTHPMLLRVPRQ